MNIFKVDTLLGGYYLSWCILVFLKENWVENSPSLKCSFNTCQPWFTLVFFSQFIYAKWMAIICVWCYAKMVFLGGKWIQLATWGIIFFRCGYSTWYIFLFFLAKFRKILYVHVVIFFSIFKFMKLLHFAQGKMMTINYSCMKGFVTIKKCAKESI